MARPVVATKPAAIPLRRQITWWVLVLPAAMIVALATNNLDLLDYTHVLSGALWTGADLLLGFIIGPVIRRLTPEQRKAVVQYLTPRTRIYIPDVALTPATAGWFLANRLGFWPGSPDRDWIIAALVVTTILAVQGLGIILPNNVRILRELQREQPNTDRISRLNRVNLMLAGIQGALQVLIIFIMAHLVMG
jgi:hypothetical protein